MSLIEKPALLDFLNPDNLISSKWIAAELSKTHKNVIRDIEMLQKEDGSNLSHQADSRGYIQEYFLPMPFAIYLLARYTGPKAVKARKLIYTALDYFINNAPQQDIALKLAQESEAYWRNECQELAAKVPKLKLPKKPSHRYVETITIHQSLFDEGGLPLMSIVTKREKKRRDLLTPAELSAANALFSSKVYIGIKTALKNHLEDFNSKLQSELGIKFNMADTLIKTLMGD